VAASLFFYFYLDDENAKPLLENQTVGFKNCRSRRKMLYNLKCLPAALTCKKSLFDCP
jgi:hypothetical protein